MALREHGRVDDRASPSDAKAIAAGLQSGPMKAPANPKPTNPPSVCAPGLPCISPVLNASSASGPDRSVVMFDLKTFAVLGRIPAAEDADAIIYDSAADRVFTFNGDADSSTVIDPRAGAIVTNILLGGKPEYGGSAGNGKVYANLTDTSEVVEIDAKGAAVTRRWSTEACKQPVAMAIDTTHHRENGPEIDDLRPIFYWQLGWRWLPEMVLGPRSGTATTSGSWSTSRTRHGSTCRSRATGRSSIAASRARTSLLKRAAPEWVYRPRRSRHGPSRTRSSTIAPTQRREGDRGRPPDDDELGGARDQTGARRATGFSNAMSFAPLQISSSMSGRRAGRRAGAEDVGLHITGELKRIRTRLDRPKLQGRGGQPLWIRLLMPASWNRGLAANAEAWCTPRLPMPTTLTRYAITSAPCPTRGLWR